jgi:hypothetical protein
VRRDGRAGSRFNQLSAPSESGSTPLRPFAPGAGPPPSPGATYTRRLGAVGADSSARPKEEVIMTAESLKDAVETLTSLARVAEEHGAYERAWALQLIAEDYEAELAAEARATVGEEKPE